MTVRFLIALLLPSVAYAETLTVDQAVAAALADHPRARAARSSADAAIEVSRSRTGRLLPTVRLSEEFQHYDSPFAISFALGGAPGTSFPVRDQNLNTFSASVDQPLLGLGGRSEQLLSAKASARAEEAAERSVRAALRESIERDFLRYFLANATESIAIASEKQLAEQLQVAQSKYDNGVLTRADLLRLEVAKKNAEQQQIMAHSDQQIARLGVLLAAGRRVDDPVELIEPTELLSAAEQPLPNLNDANDSASRDRPELQASHFRLNASQHDRRAHWWSLAPEINFEGAYLRLDGQKFVPTDSAFVGFRASWDIWEWGSTFFAARAADRQHAAAAAQDESNSRDVTLEVATRLEQSHASDAAVKVAQATIESAEEAFRVTVALINAGTATTTDLIDAQSALTQARMNLIATRYQRAMMRASLERAMGATDKTRSVKIRSSTAPE